MGCRKETIVQPKDYPYVITKNVTNIDASGVTLEARILDIGKDEITDFGFRLRNNGTDYYFSLKNKGNLNDFKVRISTDIINGATYQCRSYMRTSRNLVLGNEVIFVSLGSEIPIINDFNPKEGLDGTRVTLTGKYFSQSGSANVYVNKVLAKVIYSNEDTIIFNTPAINYVGDATINIETASHKSILNSTFKILGPVIDSVTPLSGHPGDTITIKGKNFLSYQNIVSVIFSTNYQAKIVNYSDTQIKAIVPKTTISPRMDQSVIIKVKNGLKVVSYKNNFLILKQ